MTTSPTTPVTGEMLALRDAAEKLIAHWDSMRGPEKRGEFEGVGYWSPAGRMIATEFIVELRAALAALQPQVGK